MVACNSVNVEYVSQWPRLSSGKMKCLWSYLLKQMTEASSWWPQLWIPHPLCPQSSIDLSLPRHCTSPSHIFPFPWPYRAEPGALKASGKPSWRHTTCASLKSQESSQTVPQTPSFKTSTLPSPFHCPSTSLNFSVRKIVPRNTLKIFSA